MKSFKAFLFAVVTATMLFNSQPSKAAVGAIVAAPAVVVGGLVAAGLGGSALFFGTDLFDHCPNTCEGGVVAGLLGITMIGLGVILLDGEQEIQFSTLNSKQARALGISAAELSSFNSEIDQANFLMSYVKDEVVGLKTTNFEESAKIWNEVKDQVSPETFSAMAKISSQLGK